MDLLGFKLLLWLVILVGNLIILKECKNTIPIVKGSKGGYGFAQWTGPRREMFEEWSKSNKLDPSSYDANYGFLKFELSNKNDEIGNMGVNTIKQLKKSNNLDEATSIVMNTYLKPRIPHEDKRQSRSQSVF